MPELPDLVYINSYLASRVRTRTITGVTVRQPVIVRNPFPEPAQELITGRELRATRVHGPFLVFSLSGSLELVVNLMLAGRLHHSAPGDKTPGWLCISFALEDRSSLQITDEQKMAKLYLARPGATGHIPRFDTQGLDILSKNFTEEAFRRVAQHHRRKQVRVFLNDQTALSAIGNAYADEILFEARMHPKTLVASLDAELGRLYEAIGTVIAWGIREVTRAAEPIHVKVRNHMKVRNRKGQPCPRCGSTIRREGVRGYDVFFCPSCQTPTRRSFITWSGSPESPPPQA